MENILEIRDMVVDYGIIRALKGVSLDIPKGKIVVILGANGAGKTTTMHAISAVTEAVRVPPSPWITSQSTVMVRSGSLVRSTAARGFVDAHSHLGLDNYGMGYEGQDYNEMGDMVAAQLRGIDSFNPQDKAIHMALSAEKLEIGVLSRAQGRPHAKQQHRLAAAH